MNGDCLQIRRKCDSANVIFYWEGLGCTVATEHNLLKNIGDVEVCTDFKMLKVKVQCIFFSTVGFSPRMDGRQ
jgi:hypothetical protein